MADSLRELIITLKIDGAEQAKAALDGIEKAMTGTTKSAKELDSNIVKTGQGLTWFGAFVANIAAAAVTSLAKGIANLGVSLVENVIGEAAEAELIMKKLESAILTAGLSVEKVVPEIEDLADKMARTTKFTDDEVKGLAAYALSLGATKDQLKEILPVAADFATVTGNDLKASVQAFTKSLQGNAGPLQRLMPDLKDMSEEALRAGGALKFVSKQMGGAAAAEVETFTGQMIQLKKNFADIFETLGTPIINYLGPLLKDINTLISPYTDAGFLTKFSQGLVDVITQMAIYVYDFYLFMTGGKSWLGLVLGVDQNAPLFVKLKTTFLAFFKGLLSELAFLAGEWAIPIGIQIGKGILYGIGKLLLMPVDFIIGMIAKMMSVRPFSDMVELLNKILPESLTKVEKVPENNYKNLGSFFNLPKIERKNYIGPYSQDYFPMSEKTIPTGTFQQFQQSPKSQGGNNVNQEIKMYVTGETAVDALSRQLKSTMNTFKTNVVA